jgi:riboflavin synthase
MFTGLIEEIGIVRKKTPSTGGLRLKVEAHKVTEDLKVGHSISVNGVCQTVEEVGKGYLIFFSIPETIARTNLGSLNVGDKVNLERPLKLGESLGGHLVSGHVDCVGRIVNRRKMEAHILLEVSYPPEFDRYVVPKGSIALEGISLTVVETTSGSFSVAIIPHTLENTNLGTRKIGEEVNLEFDQIAKYVEKQSRARSGQRELTKDFLERAGWL